MNPRYGLLAMILMLPACDSLTPAEQRNLQRWLLCEECVEGERDSIDALGDRAVKALEKALQGPPRKRRDNIRRQAEGLYARIASPRVSRDEYVGHYVENYVQTYKRRATVALRRINTPRAHAALVGALQPDTRHRDDVRRLLGESVGSQLSVVAGDSQHAPLDSFVKVSPTILVRDTTTGQVLSNVRVVFRVDSGGGTVSDSIRLTASNGKAGTRWRIGPSDSVNVLRVVAAGRVLRLRAVGHPPGNRIVFLVQPGTATSGGSIPPPPRIAVQDAWGTTQSGLNSGVVVRVPGTATAAQYPVVGGVATLSNLRISGAGSGFRLRAELYGLPPASSDSFDVAP